MKRILLLATAYLFLAPSSLRAQFQPASTPGILVPNSDSSENINAISNYSLGHAVFGSTNCDLYISTWSDQPYAQKTDFYYKRTLTGDPATILDQGLVAVPNASKIYGAVILNEPFSSTQFCVAVVYGNASGGGGGISFFEWTSSGLVLINQYTQTFASPDIITSMRIDAIDLSYYTVVYTVYSNNNMYAFGGDVQGTYYPLVGSVKQIGGNIPPGTGFLPDVAMTELSNPPANMLPTGIKLYFSYISPDKENCLVSYLGFDQLMSGPSPLTLNYEHTVPQINLPSFTGCSTPTYYAHYYFSRGPKIDAPDYSNDSWAVIVEQDRYTLPTSNCAPNNRVNLQVNASYKFNGGPIQDKVLNDASLPGIPISIRMSENFNAPYTNYLMMSQPAVAFSPPSPQTINFAWGITQQNSAMGGAYDYLGMDFNPSTNNYIGTPYRIIDQNPVSTPSSRSIAFSGNNVMQPDNLYTVFAGSINNPGRQEVYQKHPNWTDIAAIGYKPTDIKEYGQNKLKATALPNPFDNSFGLTVGTDYQNDILGISMRDVLGREIFSANGNIRSINQSLHQFLTGKASLNTGMYFLQLKSINSGETSTLKIIKQ